jgi:hypothetical protein
MTSLEEGVPKTRQQTLSLDKVSLPIPRDKFNLLELCELRACFEVFSSTNPIWSTCPYKRLAQRLRATFDFYEAFNVGNPKLVAISREACVRSIMEPGFADKYSKIYKYTRQCYGGDKWDKPTDFPIRMKSISPSTWHTVKTICATSTSATPEVIIPPELLYPFSSPEPEDIEYLEQDPAPNKLDVAIIKEILAEIIQPPSHIATTIDFVASQTNCKRIHTAATRSQLQARGKQAMAYKYKAVTDWFDEGMPHQDFCAVRTPVWKRTTEYRDAISCNPYTLYRIWELNTALKSMIKHKGVGDYTDMRDLKFMWLKHPTFILTDWKKSGLTIPHWFVKLVIEEVVRKHPTYYGTFPVDGIPIWDPKKQKWFQNEHFGYGLGMVNNVYTLFNITLFEYAKRAGIFTDEDEILSFNDDSVIGCEEFAYNRWLDICQDSGGYVDRHKTVQSKGIQFCEMHQGKLFYNNFKWVSAFHTLMAQSENAVNLTHWRFLISDSWESIRGYGWQVRRLLTDDLFIEHLVQVTLTSAERFFGMPLSELNGVQPELGGFCLGHGQRTEWGLRIALCNLEKLTGKQYWYSANLLRIWKESQHWTYWPKYREWEKFPQGKTAERMAMLGRCGGLFSALEPLRAKTKNHFALESTWQQKQYWTKLERQLLQVKYQEPTIFNVDDWAGGHRWAGYAVPDFLIEECVPNSNDGLYIPFARINKVPNKYSILTQLEALHNWLTYGSAKVIPDEEMDMSNFILHEIPVITCQGSYLPVTSMETTSQLAGFDDPRRVILDHCDRKGAIIYKLKVKDYRGYEMARFLERATSLKEGSLYKATWYTKTPIPYCPEAESWLHHHLPTDHELVLRLFYSGAYVHSQHASDDIPFEFIGSQIKDNPHFWRRSQNTRKARKNAFEAAPENIGFKITWDDDQILTQIHADDLTALIRSYYTRDTPFGPATLDDIVDNITIAEEEMYLSDEELPAVEYAEFSIADLPTFEIPEISSDEDGNDPDEGYDSQDETQSAYERRLVSEALDCYNSDPESDEDRGVG